MARTQTNYSGPIRTFRQAHGPSPLSGSVQARGGAGGTIYVDLTDAMTRLMKAFDFLSEDVKNRAFYNAINRLGRPLLTAIRRDVAQQSGAKYGRVMKAIKADLAHPNRLTFKIIATDTAMKVSDFARSLKPGTKNPSAAPWNKSRRFQGAFVIRFKSGAAEIVKRIGKHNKSGKIRTLWGPILPKEMLRPGSPSLYHIAHAIPDRLEPVLRHEVAQAIARAKAASGT